MASVEISPRVTPKDRNAWRRWLEEHHAGSAFVWVLLRKGGAARTSLRYDEAVEEALCFGWIDRQIRRVDETYYAQRFTPRREGSRWSESNLSRVRRLLADGRMTPAGLRQVPANERRDQAAVAPVKAPPRDPDRSRKRRAKSSPSRKS